MQGLIRMDLDEQELRTRAERHGSGFRIQPLQIEFWRARPFRLHERLCYRRETLDSAWTTERLFP